MGLVKFNILVFLQFIRCKDLNKISIKVVNGLVTNEKIALLFYMALIGKSGRLATGTGVIRWGKFDIPIF